jgi:DNA-binding response OmpR family regulator
VLLVEDDAVTAAALIAILRRRGFEVFFAATVAQSLALLKEHQPAFVVLDLMLPDGEGIEVLRHIRDNSLTARVLVTTAVSDPIRLHDVRGLSPDVVMQKPINVQDLIQLMLPMN